MAVAYARFPLDDLERRKRRAEIGDCPLFLRPISPGAKIVDAKAVVDEANSPQLGTSSEFFQRLYRQDQLRELGRYRSAIQDPNNPLTTVEIISNDARAVPFWEALLRQADVPGTVVVRSSN